ncbi:unnamed protein product [Gordionus sp. m RMFG-2023]
MQDLIACIQILELHSILGQDLEKIYTTQVMHAQLHIYHNRNVQSSLHISLHEQHQNGHPLPNTDKSNDHTGIHMNIPMHIPFEGYTYADASDTHLGLVIRGKMESFTIAEACFLLQMPTDYILHINGKKLLAVMMVPLITNTSNIILPTIHSDSTTVYYAMRKGWCRSSTLEIITKVMAIIVISFFTQASQSIPYHRFQLTKSQLTYPPGIDTKHKVDKHTLRGTLFKSIYILL